MSSLRTPGRSLVVEGPSGIGKTTAILNAFSRLGISGTVCKLSSRNQADIELIKFLPDVSRSGVIMIDDFHCLHRDVKICLADYLKYLADNEDTNTKIVVLGINRAGDSLIHLASDLVNRIDIEKFEVEPDAKIYELIRKGEEALNVELSLSDEIVDAAKGSFYLAQMLCREVCLAAGVVEALDDRKKLSISFESLKAAVWERQGQRFNSACEDFCRGTRLRKEGRAPYLHILNWLAAGQTWTLDLRQASRDHSKHSGSITQVIEKGFLKNLIESIDEIHQVLHFDEDSELLTIEDPHFLFYIRNIAWRQFARRIGFLSVEFSRRYDFAL